MDLQAATDFLGTNELLCDLVSEQPIEGEFTIPDYQPEIFKIIKAKAEPVVVQKLAVGTRTTVDGYIRLTVIYQSESDRRLFAITQKLPFSKQADLREAVGNDCTILCGVTISYLNCRAVNQRRIDVRGAANISIRVLSGSGSDVVSDISGDGAQQRRESVEFTRQTAMDEKQFTLEEALSIDFEGVEAPSVLRSEAHAIPESVEIENGRAIISGSVYVLIALDVSDASEYRIKRAGFSLPFNQVVDLESAGPGAKPIATVSILSVNAEVEETDIVGVAVLCAVEVRAYENDQVTLVSDAFSTRCELDMVRETVSVTLNADTIRESVSVRQTIDKPAVGQKLIDYFLVPGNVIVESDDIKAQARVNGVFSYLLSDESGAIQCYDSPVEFVVALNIDCGNVFSAPMMAFTMIDCTETDEAVSFKAEGLLYGQMQCIGKLTAVKSVTQDTSKPKERSDMALAIYYADAGEDIFSIAKAFNTSPREIAQENNVADGVLEAKSMLLIPIVE